MNQQQRLTSSDQVDHFDRLSSDYKAIHDKALFLAGGASDHFYLEKIKHIQRRMFQTPKSILDFGCGTGRLTGLLAAHFPEAKIHGVDPSKDSIEQAKAETPLSITYSTNLEHIPEQSYDLVIAAGVFHHIHPRDRAQNIALVHRALKPGGQFMIFEHNGLSLQTRLLLAIAGNDKGAHLLSAGQMERRLQEGKFSQIQTDYISFFPTYFSNLLKFEKHLRWCPLGAQFFTSATKEFSR